MTWISDIKTKWLKELEPVERQVMSQSVFNLDEFVQERKWHAQSGVKYVSQNKIKAPDDILKTYREIFQNYLEAKKAELFHATKGLV